MTGVTPLVVGGVQLTLSELVVGLPTDTPVGAGTAAVVMTRRKPLTQRSLVLLPVRRTRTCSAATSAALQPADFRLTQETPLFPAPAKIQSQVVFCDWEDRALLPTLG